MRPLTLYWRRRQMSSRIISRRLTPQTFTTSITNFVTRVTLHAHSHTGERVRELRVLVPSPASTVRAVPVGAERETRHALPEEPRFRQRRAPWLPPIPMPHTLPARAREGCGRLAVRAMRAPTIREAAALRGQRPPVWQSSATSPGARGLRSEPPSRQLALPEPAQARSAVRAEAETALPSRAHSHTTPRVIPSRREGTLPSKSPARRVPQADGAPLVWRPSRAVIDNHHDGVPVAEMPSVPRPPAAAMANANTSTPSTSSSRVVTRTDAAPTLAFDGPALDRLAEDVMSRIDRRIRIERERRGL